MSVVSTPSLLPLPSPSPSSLEAITGDPAFFPESSAWSTDFLPRFHPATHRSRQYSPRSVIPLSILSSSTADVLRSRRPHYSGGIVQYRGLRSILSSLLRRSECLDRGMVLSQNQGMMSRKDSSLSRRHWLRNLSIVVLVGVVGFFLLVNWYFFSRLHHHRLDHRKDLDVNLNSRLQALVRQPFPGKQLHFEKVGRLRRVMYTRLFALATHSLADVEGKPEPRELWKETLVSTVSWTPCAHQRNWESSEGTNGYILVSANGGVSQQRVAICNAVAIARLLNSTLVLPKFLYSNVWQDISQFSNIYQEEHFINYLKADIKIVKELPVELQSLDLEAIGSLLTDAEIRKEAKPSFYMKKVLPILLKNGVVHFTGFGNRLAFDPVPFDMQRLRCRCNFHALRFINKIQEAGALLVQRMRLHGSHWTLLEHSLLDPYSRSNHKANATHPTKASRYLAMHLRFEIDMVAYSLCYFGGGKEEVEELEAYRDVHFPALSALRNNTKLPAPEVLRSEGQCPLTPEETVLLLAALGFKRKTKIYVAGANIYGGKSRMASLKSLYPNLETKESLLSPSEIEPFHNFSSQLAALDFIACSAADAFTMTDPGSQFSSLIAGYRVYYGGKRHPTIRPNKRRLVGIFTRNRTIEWKQFEASVRKAVKQSKMVQERPTARSVYRHPRCLECMCPADS